METASPPNPFLSQNGSDLFCGGGTQNGTTLTCYQDQDEEEDFGPETDVDAVDDLIQPNSIAAAKALISSKNKESVAEDDHNDEDEDDDVEMEDEEEKQQRQMNDFDNSTTDVERADSSAPKPIDAANSAEADNVAESGGEGEDSDEEEWNYIKGDDQTEDKEKDSQTPPLTQQEIEDMESQLNPEAPPFTPTSVCDKLVNDKDISSSPMKGSERSLESVSLPTQNDFHHGIMECAGEFNRLNGNEENNFNQLADDKFKAINDSEILSTKAEFGDDSVFSFNNSLNTSTAFSSGIPHDDDKDSSDLLSNENDFDPPMNAPKELRDLVSSEPDDELDLVSDTPRSTVAEAPLSPETLDFKKDDDFPSVPSNGNLMTESFYNDKNIFGQEEERLVDAEPQKPLTFAEVLKRPSPKSSPEGTPRHSPRTSPEPPVLEKDVKKINESESIKNEYNNELNQQFEINNLEKPSEVQSFDNINPFDEHCDNIIENEVNISSSILSEFVTHRKSPIDEKLTEFEDLKSPEDDKPPQFFQVDDNIQIIEDPKLSIDVKDNHFNIDSDIESTKDDIHQEFESSNQLPDNLVINATEVQEFKSDFQYTDDFNFTPSQAHDDKKQIIAEELKIDENEFDVKSSPIEIKENYEFKESHFKEPEKVDILKDFTTENFTNIESNLNAQHINFEKSSEELDFLSENIKSVPQYKSAVEESVNLLDNDLNNSHQHVLSSKDTQFIFGKSPRDFFQQYSKNSQEVLEAEIAIEANEDSVKNTNPFLEETDLVQEDAAIEAILSEFVTSSNIASEIIPDIPIIEEKPLVDERIVKEKPLAEEPVVEQKQSEPLSSVKQQEETLEQTINVDFIPAEPLLVPETQSTTPSAPIEELITSEQVKPEEPVKSDVEPVALESVEEAAKDISSPTPPPTPAPGVDEQKLEEKQGLLSAAAAVAVAGAAATAGVVAAKTATKKPTTGAPKKTASTAPKKPTDLKTGTKPSTVAKSSTASKSAISPTKPAAAAAKKPIASTTTTKTTSKPAVGAKTTAKPTTKPGSIGTKSTTPTSKPSTPTSKPTTPTASSRPSSAQKSTSVKSPITSKTSTVPKPKTTTSVDKKPLTNGDVSKTATKKTDIAAKKPLTSTTTKTATAASKPLAAKTAATKVTNTVSKTSNLAAKTGGVTANKPKPITKPATSTTTNAAVKAKLPAKTDKTIKEAVNNKISSTSPKVGTTKTAPAKANLTKKTDSKTPPGKTAATKPAGTKSATAIKRPASMVNNKAEEKSEQLTQDHIVTTTNGFVEEIVIENGISVEEFLSHQIENNICDVTAN